MPSTSPHIINRLVLRLHLADTTDSREVQQRAEQELQSRRLFSSLDEVLSELGSPDEWITLERVVVALGPLQSALLERQLTERLPDMLRPAMADAVATARSQGAVRTKDALDFESFVYFLRNGVLPAYSYVLPVLRQWEPQLVALVGNLSSDQQASLRQALTSANARQRLMTQFSVLLWLAVGTALEPAVATQLRQLAELLLQMRHLPYDEAAVPLDSLMWEKIMQRLSYALPTNWPLVIKQITAVNKAAESRQLETARNLLAELLSGENLLASVTHRDAEEELASDVHFVENAGVVLLHPFLAVCFEACGWLTDGTFRNETVQMQAVRLIHFLATGNSQAAEYELLVPKLLCGMPAHQPQNARVRLPRQARVEGLALLNAAIEHWQALKNTSPAGLREGFLQRDGKLERSADGRWTLTVEQKAQDLLLDQLPYGWGLGVVQLPWMPQRLMINWG
ncbi:contractile injection system tape measure protein [Hymenobacter sp. GOD-10R]|uniref:contractile injection system tape measure protein n=1 Tax=Hymenobacter sp. GOD-10R TaxID=3093922 RepID=UPI002D776666|nr:contractile injection system tape measure protein [Hymenobacter sp. GOD-10R]WRQ30107.1 contractile injection system tape measure protein [Hymenobacter sp. GOD-10R]